MRICTCSSSICLTVDSLSRCHRFAYSLQFSREKSCPTIIYQQKWWLISCHALQGCCYSWWASIRGGRACCWKCCFNVIVTWWGSEGKFPKLVSAIITHHFFSWKWVWLAIVFLPPTLIDWRGFYNHHWIWECMIKWWF